MQIIVKIKSATFEGLGGKMRIPVFFLSLMILLSACSSIYVVYDYDVQADFSKYKSFKWDMSRSELGFKNQLLDKRLRYSIDLELIGKGFQYTEQNADLVLTYEQTTRTERDIYVMHSYPGWRHGGWGHRNVFVDKRKEALITLKIFDAETNELIWQSWASGIEVVIEDVEKIIKNVAAQLVANFPPPQK